MPDDDKQAQLEARIAAERAKAERRKADLERAIAENAREEPDHPLGNDDFTTSRRNETRAADLEKLRKADDEWPG